MTQRQIEEVVNLVQKVLGSNALGVYLYGSYTLGGLQKNSDLDILVVSNRPTAKHDKATLVKSMLEISIDDPEALRRSVELTIVVQSDVKPWHYPSKLDFQYGEWMRDEFEKGNVEPRDSNVEPDLAISITQVLLSGKVLAGKEPSQLLDPVPYQDFMTATASEVGDVMAELETDTRNMLLTLTRIWATLSTASITSKPNAAKWALLKLPEEYKPVNEHACASSIGGVIEDWLALKGLIKPCAYFIIDQIEKLKSSLDLDLQRQIRISN